VGPGAQPFSLSAWQYGHSAAYLPTLPVDAPGERSSPVNAAPWYPYLHGLNGGPRDRGAMGQTAAPSWTTGPHNGWTNHRGPGQAQWVDYGGYPDYVKDGPKCSHRTAIPPESSSSSGSRTTPAISRRCGRRCATTASSASTTPSPPDRHPACKARPPSIANRARQRPGVGDAFRRWR
jgi:hypothetical protein